jgi:signal transduction histidine kinase
MNIRSRLTLTFTIIVGSIMLVFSGAIYYFSSLYRENEFYKRLIDKANTTAHFLLEVDEITPELLKIIDRNNLTSLFQEQVIIYNYQNKVIYDSDEDPVRESSIPKELFNEIRLKGEIKSWEKDTQVVGVTFNRGDEQFVVVASAYDQFGYSKLHNLQLILIAGLVIALIIVAIAGKIYAGRAISPITEIVEQVDDITVSNLSQRVNAGNGKDEIAVLATTFNKMLKRLQEAFETQRIFVSNASHELRTPLTVITGEIDVALIKRRSQDEYEHILHSIRENIKSLNKLSNGLLDLAQVSLDLSHIHFSKVQIDDLLFETRALLLSKQPDYFINVEFQEDEEEMLPFTTNGDGSLLKTAFINLMENACKFSSDKQVRVALGASAENLLLHFSDNGIGIDAEDLQKIFEPFYRTERTKSIKGHGIGLSLTERIVLLHNGTLTVQSIVNKGTTFTIILPVLAS